jgi:hypothetical protein
LSTVVVDGGIGHALLRLGIGALQVVDEFLDSGHESRLTPMCPVTGSATIGAG